MCNPGQAFRVVLFVFSCVLLSAPASVGAAEKRSKVLILSEEARANLSRDEIRKIAREEEATIALAAKLPAYTRYIDCDVTSAEGVLGWLGWACDTEYFCANTMSLTIKVGGQTYTCSYEDCKLVGDKCDCDLKAGQHSGCPK